MAVDFCTEIAPKLSVSPLADVTSDTTRNLTTGRRYALVLTSLSLCLQPDNGHHVVNRCHMRVTWSVLVTGAALNAKVWSSS